MWSTVAIWTKQLSSQKLCVNKMQTKNCLVNNSEQQMQEILSQPVGNAWKEKVAMFVNQSIC